MKNNKGQSTVESSIVVFLTAIFVSALLLTLYLLFSSYWVEHIMYESMICYQEKENKHACLSEAKNKIQSILVFKDNIDLDLESQGSRTVSHLKLKLNIPFIKEKTFLFVKDLRV